MKRREDMTERERAIFERDQKMRCSQVILDIIQNHYAEYLAEEEKKKKN